MLHRASKYLDEPFGSIESNRELLQSAAGQKKSQKPSKGPKYRWGFRKYLNPRTNPTLWGWELVGRAANASIDCVMVFSNVPSKISSIRDDPDFKPRDFPPKVDVCKSKKSLDQSEQRAEMFAINQFKSKVNESFDEKFPTRAISSLQIPQPSPPC